MASSMDWDRLKELTHGRGKFDYEFWHSDIKKITSNEGKVSLLQAYIDNSKKGVEPEAIKMIVNAGVDVNHVNKDDENAFWTAFMRSGDKAVYKALIDCGINVNHHADGFKDIASAYMEYTEKKGWEFDNSVL